MGYALEKEHCKPCEKGGKALHGLELERFHRELSNRWLLVDKHHLEKTYHFKGWKDAVEFVDQVAKVADDENHHPDVQLSWGKVTIQLWTHSVDGLTRNDFIVAAKIDAIA